MIAMGTVLAVSWTMGLAVASAPTEPTAADAQNSLNLAARWLLDNQEKTGAWGSQRNAIPGWDDWWSNPETHISWTVAVTGLGCMAVLEYPPSDETRKAFDRGVDFIVEHAEVKRISEWDVDNTWAYVYAVPALVRAYTRTPSSEAERKEKIREAALRVLAKLEETQTPSGGWGYYDFDAYTHPGSWATSFMTASALLGLLDARDAGLPVSPKMIECATRAIKRSRLPSGAYTYSVEAVPSPGGMEWIDQIKGSLSRIQVCNLALHRAGEPISLDDLRAGLDHFFDEHRFLDIARQKPIPHEAYYFNSGYFYFYGHYYASDVIALLPPEDQAKYWPKLRQEVIKTQERDGSMWDYHMNSYGRPYGVAFSMLTLAKSIAPPDVPATGDKKVLQETTGP